MDLIIPESDKKYRVSGDGPEGIFVRITSEVILPVHGVVLFRDFRGRPGERDYERGDRQMSMRMRRRRGQRGRGHLRRAKVRLGRRHFIPSFLQLHLGFSDYG